MLRAAQELFLERGYEGATLRAIAGRVGVDASLIHHYFGRKSSLFAAAMALKVAPSRVLQSALDAPDTELADRLLISVLRVWEDEESARALRLLIDAAIRDAAVMRMFREYIDGEVLARLEARIGGPGARGRAAAALEVIIGLIFGRYVLAIGSLAEMDPRTAYAVTRENLRRALSPPRGSAERGRG